MHARFTTLFLPPKINKKITITVNKSYESNKSFIVLIKESIHRGQRNQIIELLKTCYKWQCLSNFRSFHMTKPSLLVE